MIPRIGRTRSSENGMASRRAVLTGTVVKSACGSTRNRSGASAPYLSRTRRVSMGKGHAIPSTVRSSSFSLTFIGEGREDLVRRVVPAGGVVEDGLAPLRGGKEGEQAVVGVAVAVAGRHHDRPLAGVQERNRLT